MHNIPEKELLEQNFCIITIRAGHSIKITRIIARAVINDAENSSYPVDICMEYR